jgi:ATP-dependent Clp protease ATP-binding subunit ClpC
MTQQLLLDDRSRKVMQYASREAFSRNHDTIGPEHVLLGLLKEGTGMTESVVKIIDRDFGHVRTLIDQLLPPGPNSSLTGKLPNSSLTGKLPHSDETTHVLEYSRDEAATAKFTWVTPAHLLLGITRLPDGIAKQVIEQLRISADAIRRDITIEQETGNQ